MNKAIPELDAELLRNQFAVGSFKAGVAGRICGVKSFHRHRADRDPAAPRLRIGNDRNARLRWLSVGLTLAPRLTRILDAVSSKLCSGRRRRIDEILALA